jgi:protein O-mannosyl-transferase
MDRIKDNRLTLLSCLFLVATTLAVFWPVIHYDFVNCDDQAYVYENPALQAGLSWQGLTWAFTTGYAVNWHPLTWLSHLLDVNWFGLNAGWHHLTSLLLHTTNALLLFLVLKRMTAALWPSMFVAALFALHPLHVESVAWIAERKDVLSAFFFFLTLWAYARYSEVQSLKSKVQSQFSAESEVQSPKPKVQSHSGQHSVQDAASAATLHSPRSTLHASLFYLPSSISYLLALFFFACGLMSKPMLVTVPFLLLLLDYWPLRRLSVPALHHSTTPLLHLVLEKLPFFALAAASSVVTFLVQQRAGAVAVAGALPLDLRLENAFISYALYLAKTVWPAGLAIFYPYRHNPAGGLLASSVLVLVITSVLAGVSWRARPYVLVGWLWFLGTLVPVIGIIQVGQQAMADRYTYIPLIGIFIAVAWAAAEWGKTPVPEAAEPAAGTARAQGGAIALASGAAVAIAACWIVTYCQVRHWQNSIALFRHTLEVTTDNAVAHHSLGDALGKLGQIREAEPHFAEAVRLKPDYPEALSDLGVMRVMQGKVEEGIQLYRAAIAVKPSDWRAHNNLGRALCLQGKFDEGVREYQTALEINPGTTDTRGYLAAAFVELGKPNEAKGVFENALLLKPDDATLHFKYASLLMALGQTEAATLHFRTALQYGPGEAEVHRRYGLLLSASGNTGEAIAQFQEAIRLQPGAETHYNLATALLQQGQTERAVTEYRESLRLNPDSAAALNDLAWLLAASANDRLRNGTEAVALAERACQLTQFQQPMLIGTLAAAYAEAGRFDEAVKTAMKAKDGAAAAGLKELVERNGQLLELYRVGKPFHEAR